MSSIRVAGAGSGTGSGLTRAQWRAFHGEESARSDRDALWSSSPGFTFPVDGDRWRRWFLIIALDLILIPFFLLGLRRVIGIRDCFSLGGFQLLNEEEKLEVLGGESAVLVAEEIDLGHHELSAVEALFVAAIHLIDLSEEPPLLDLERLIAAEQEVIEGAARARRRRCRRDLSLHLSERFVLQITSNS